MTNDLENDSRYDPDIAMIDSSLRNIAHLYEQLNKTPVELAIKKAVDVDEVPVADKRRLRSKSSEDTEYFDWLTERILAFGYGDRAGHYGLLKQCTGEDAVIVTEESGRIGGKTRIEPNTPVLVTDPFDGSSYLEEIAKANPDAQTIGQLFEIEREKIGNNNRATFEGCNTSITVIRHDNIQYSIILNFFTGDVFLAYKGGVFRGDIREATSVAQLTNPVKFRDDNSLDMICYKREGKYQDNFDGTRLSFFNFIPVKYPVGPSRFTYLLKESQGETPIAVVAHNGEKLQESLPDIAVAHFSRGALVAYKLFCDPQKIRSASEKPLTPTLGSSIYSGPMKIHGVSTGFLNGYQNPNEFRDTTVIVPATNHQAITMLEGMVRREHAIKII